MKKMSLSAVAQTASDGGQDSKISGEEELLVSKLRLGLEPASLQGWPEPSRLWGDGVAGASAHQCQQCSSLLPAGPKASASESQLFSVWPFGGWLSVTQKVGCQRGLRCPRAAQRLK